MIYQIDSIAVSTRADWRHSRIPRQPQSRRIGVFPGVGERFVMRDTPMPGGVRVVGYLQGIGTGAGGAVAALRVALDTYGTMQSDGSLHDVRVHDETFADCFLESFRVAGPVEAFDPGTLSAGQIAVQQMVEWIWHQTVNA